LKSTSSTSSRGISSKARKKTSKKKIAGIVVLVIIGIFGALIAIGLSLNSTSSAFTHAGSPSDQEIETQIAQASTDQEMDRLWNKELNMCIDWHLKGNNLYEVQCDGRTMTEERDSYLSSI
jgi:hypothetical protein